MKSLACTLVELLAGTLPWADTRSDDSDELLSIIHAHSGSTLCQGYDDCFARFIDYTRSLQYEDTPNYQYWRDAFRELVSGLFKAAMFDPDDASEPRVGMQKNFDRPPHTVDWPKPPQAEHTAGGSDPFLRAYSEGTPSRQMAEGTDSSRIWAPLGAVERPFRRAICSGTNSRSSRPTSSSSTHPQTMLVDCALIRGELPRRR